MKYSNLFQQNVPEWISKYNDELESDILKYTFKVHPLDYGEEVILIINDDYANDILLINGSVRNEKCIFRNDITKCYQYHISAGNTWKLTFNIVHGEVMGANKLVLLDPKTFGEGELDDLKTRLKSLYRMVVAHNTKENEK